MAEQERVEQLGRIGVVIIPVEKDKPGVIAIRSTAYELAGRPDPEPGTSQAGLEVAPVFNAKGFGSVSAEDEANARSAQ